MKRKVVLELDELHDAVVEYVRNHKLLILKTGEAFSSQVIYEDGGCEWACEFEVTASKPDET